MTQDPLREAEQWARERAEQAPDALVTEFSSRVLSMHFRERAAVLDAAIAARGTLAAPLARALFATIDADALRATLECLPPTALARLINELSQTPDALFALSLAAWPGPLPCVSIARMQHEFVGADSWERALIAVIEGDYRASSRVRAVFELVASGPSRAGREAIARRVEDTVHDLRTSAVRALARLGESEALLRALRSPHATVRSDARLLLVQLVNNRDAPVERVAAVFTELAHDPSKSARERYEARRTLREIGAPIERAPWSGLHEDAAESLAHEIKTLANRLAISEYVTTLADTDDPRALDAVRAALATPAKVGRALAGFRPYFKGPAGARALRKLTRDADPLVRDRAVELSRMR